MEFNSLCESWIETINGLKEHLKTYIYKINSMGLYKLDNDWPNIVKDIEDMKDVSSDITTNNIDLSESYYFQLNEIIDKIRSMLDSDSNNKSIIKSILDSSKLAMQIYKKLLNLEFVSEKIQGFNHGLIVMKSHLIQLKKADKAFFIQKYKYNILSEYDKKQYEINSSLPVLQKINYLIKPLVLIDKKPMCFNIVNKIEYNILPLINKKEAYKFGPILKTSHGLTKQIINRFKTIYDIESITESENYTYDEFTKDSACIYNGYAFSEIRPVNYNPGITWKPLSGIHPIVYKINKEKEDIILSKMIIDDRIYKSFDSSSYKQLISPDIMLAEIKVNSKLSVENIVSRHCFNILNNKIKSIDVSDDMLESIKKELTVMQYQNISSIVEKLKKEKVDMSTVSSDINLLPIKYILYFLKLI